VSLLYQANWSMRSYIHLGFQVYNRLSRTGSAVPQHQLRAASSTALAPQRHRMVAPCAPSCNRLNTPLCSEGSWEYTHHVFPQCTSGQDAIHRVKGWMIPVRRGMHSTPLLDLLLEYRPRLPHQDFHCLIHIMELHYL
jgi:hypothetical protein